MLSHASRIAAVLFLTTPLTAALVGCTEPLPPPPPQGEQDGQSDGDAASQEVLLGDSLIAVTRPGEIAPSPLSTPAPARRVAVLVELSTDDGSVPALRVRDGSALVDVAWTWSEGRFAVAGFELSEPQEEVEIRLLTETPQDVAAVTFGGGPSAVADGPIQTDYSIDSGAGGLGVRSRASWGARARRCGSQESSKSRFTVHHTVTSRSSTSGYEGRMRAIQSFHMDGRGWCDIAYNYLVTEDGQLWEGRGNWRGAHVKNDNAGNIGVSFIGCFHSSDCAGLGGATPPEAMIERAASLIGGLAEQYGVAVNASQIKGHRERGQTSCPGDHLFARMSDIRALALAPPPTLPPSCFDDVGGRTLEDAVCWLGEQGLTQGCGGDSFCPTATTTRAQVAVFLDRFITLVTGQVLPTVSTAFTDVPSGHFAAASIARIYGAGLTSGTGPNTFSPEQEVTRGQMAAFLDRTYTLLTGITAPTVPTPFIDLDGHFAAAAVARVYGLGLTAGVDPTHFGPNQLVTREQVAAFLFRLFQLDFQLDGLGTTELPISDESPSACFDDVDGHWAESEICTIAEMELTSGCDANRYCPANTVTRAQMAVFLDRLFTLAEGAAPSVVETPFIDVDAGHYAADSIARIYGLGITQGTDATHFGPNNPVTRAQMAVFLDRTYSLLTGAPAAVAGTPFTDVPAGHYAAASIGRIFGLGITTGVGPSTFGIDQQVDRAQMAVFLVRLWGVLPG